MPNPLMIMDYANFLPGSAPDDETFSNHLTLTEVKLPAFDVQYSDHRAAGAPIYIEIGTGIARLEATFVLVGLVPQTMELVDSWVASERNFFIYGSVRDQLSGDATQAAAAFVGQLGRADPQNFRKGDVMHTNFSIRNITHYEFGIGGELTYSGITSPTPDLWVEKTAIRRSTSTCTSICRCLTSCLLTSSCR